MKKRTITIKHSIFVHKPKELVWDYTQNYENRMKWDHAVLEASVLQTTPNRIVKLKLKGATTMTFIYKLDERPGKTTLVAKEITSPFIESAGGSWSYEERNGVTQWTQTNTIIFKATPILRLLLLVYKLLFSIQTKQAMKNARREMEKQ
jgi:hypothetical protein